nr:uncharacterized protein LOC119175547 [Rhipicephalus microplus]
MGKCGTQKTREGKFAGNCYTATRLLADTNAGISVTAKKLKDINKAYQTPLENSALQGIRIMDIGAVQKVHPANEFTIQAAVRERLRHAPARHKNAARGSTGCDE